MSFTTFLVLLICSLSAGLYLLYTRLREREATIQARDSAIQQLQRKYAAMSTRFNSLAEIEAVHQRLTRETQGLMQQQAQLTKTLRQLGNSIVQVQADLDAHHTAARIESTGYAKDRFSIDVPAFKQRLDDVKSRQKQMVADGKAAILQARWTVGGNAAEGRHRQEQVLNLMLRAFDGQCEAALAQVKAYGLEAEEKRIRQAFAGINRLVATQKCALTESYLNLRLEQLFTTEAYRRRLKTDKEAQREAQARIREELREARKFEEARVKAQQDVASYAEALRRATEQAQHAFGSERHRYAEQIEQLKQSLNKAQETNKRATAQAQLTTAGHVYVISNVGSFGEHVYKIGMTRRLEPTDRIDELSNASVPFPFDVHAIIACDNAPMLERRLHQMFQHRRVNMANERKEFFQVPLQEIAAAVRANHGDIRFVHEAAADEYRETKRMRARA